MTLEATLEQFGVELGFDQVGFCVASEPVGFQHYIEWLEHGFQADMEYMSRSKHLRTRPQSLLPGAKSVVAVAQNYYQDLPDRDVKIARYALGRDYHKVVKGKLKKLAMPLLDQGHSVRLCVDSAPILEREFAHQAGLGWFGKNTMLINSRRGSWFFIGLIITSAELAPSVPSVGGCGTCSKCIEACPTGAIVQLNGRWTVDSRSCLSYQTIENDQPIPAEIASKNPGWVFGCDICQEVCPFNEARSNQPERANATRETDFIGRAGSLTLEEFADMDDVTWDEWTRGRALRRAKVEKWRSTARVLLQTKEGE